MKIKTIIILISTFLFTTNIFAQKNQLERSIEESLDLVPLSGQFKMITLGIN